MSRKYERNDKIALLYPANLLAAQTYFQLSFVFLYSSESYLAGEILLHFGGIHVFVPYVEQFLPNLVRIIRLISKQIFHPKLIPFDNFVSFFGVVHLFVRPVRQKSSGIFSIFAIMCILVVRPPTLLPTCLCSPSQRMLAAVLCALMVVRSIMAILLLPAFAA